MKKNLATLLFFFSITTAYCQTNVNEWNIMSRVPAGNNKIKIRWMPDNSTNWQKGITKGYTITKNTYSATGTPLSTQNITIDPVLPNDSLATKWMAYWKPDSTIYKTLFYLTINQKVDTLGGRAIPKDSVVSSLEDERYFYANLLADMRFKAAELCGLGYTDAAVIAGQKYEYIIKITGETTPSWPSTGQILVSTSALPTTTLNFTGEPRRLKVNWNTQNLIDYYSGYYVEKSTNAGASYTRLTTDPRINFEADITWMNHPDSIPNATATYRYKVIGISYFDEFVAFPTKDTTVTKVIEYTPGIRAATVSGSNYKVNWRYPYDQTTWSAAAANADLTSYSLAVSKKPEAVLGESQFKIIKTGILKSDSTTTVTRASVYNALDNDTTKVFYFYVVAVSTGAASVQSNPYGYIPQIKDNTAPSVPKNAAIATPVAIAGGKTMLKVSWTRSTDNTGGVGVMGYQVFRTLGTDTEKIEVSGGIRNTLLSTDTTKAYVQDTLSSSLNYQSVKYYISAFDNNYNKSADTLVTYTQPDRTRPLPPKITSVAVDSLNKVTLNFTLSPSKRSETITHQILRKESLSAAWTVVSTITAAQNTTTYLDNSTLGGKEYFYSVRAKDASNNYSCDSLPALPYTTAALPSGCYQTVSAKTLNLSKKTALSTLTQVYDETSKSVTLTWTYSLSLVKGYEIYRGVTASPVKYAYLAFVDEPTKTYTDFKVDYNTAYSYRVRAVFTDGSVSNWKNVATASLKKSTLASNKETLVFTSVAATEIATITSNVAWTVTKSASWITTSVTSGTNNGSITIGVTASTDTLIRQGTVTLTSGNIISTVINVTQYPAPRGTGITVKYYNFPDLASIQSRPPNLSQLKTQVNLSTSAAPTSGVTADFCSIWEGFIEVPKTGNYTFYVQADQGAYLYINGIKIATSSGNIESSSTAQSLTFGTRYPIKIEHWDGAAYAGLKLQWSSNVGLAKTIVSTPYIYPTYVPTVNQQDPLNGNCFVIRRPSNNYTIQTPGDFTIVEGSYSNKNNQKWKLVREGTLYKIVSQIDALNKDIQVLNNGSALYNKTVLGFNGSKSSEKWNLISQGNNLYKINRSGTSYNLGIDNNVSPTPSLYSGGEAFLFEMVTCPNYVAGITLDTDELNLDFKQQTATVQLKSDVEWSVTNYNDWININPIAGVQNAAVGISVVKNFSSSPRSGSVAFKNKNGTAYVTVKQEARPCVEMSNVVTDCGIKAPVGVTIINSDGTTGNSGLYQYSIDSQGVWKDKLYQLSYLSNGSHVIHARLKTDHACTGSVPFELYCY